MSKRRPRKPKFFIKISYEDLELTARGKFICPACENSFWGGREVWERHRRELHAVCVCGRWFMAAGLKQHQKKCKVALARTA